MPRTKFLFKLLILLSCISVLAACGFKIYDRNDLPPQVHTMYFQTKNPHGRLEVELKNALETSGIVLTDNAKDAPVIFNVITTSFTHDNPNVLSSAQATVYTFTYTLVFNLQDQKGQSIIPPQYVTSSRTVTLNPNEVIESSPEVATTQEDMGRDLIFQTFGRLNANNTKAALAKTVKTNEPKS